MPAEEANTESSLKTKQVTRTIGHTAHALPPSQYREIFFIRK
jgi:hypothetical protein